jgi:hypothetical protein
MILTKNSVQSPVSKSDLTPIMSKAEVDAKRTEGKDISQILADESTSSGLSSISSAAPAPAPLSLEEGCIAKYNDEKVFVLTIDKSGYINIKNKDRREFPVRNTALTPIMSKAKVDSEKNRGKTIDELLIGGKGRRRSSTRKYHKRRGRGNGNNGRRRLTRKVKGQSGGGGGGGARRGGKIHRKTKKNVRRGRGGRRGHRRTIKKYHRR